MCDPGPSFGEGFGDWTRTLGGELVGDLGGEGEKAIMDVGRGFPLLFQGMRPSVLDRGVTQPEPL